MGRESAGIVVGFGNVALRSSMSFLLFDPVGKANSSHGASAQASPSRSGHCSRAGCSHDRSLTGGRRDVTIGLNSADQASRPRALMSWSSGKDSAWALHNVRQRGDVDVVALLTTFNSEFDRVSMHGVRRALVDIQAQQIGLPVWSVELPSPCSNDEYEQRIAKVMERAQDAGITRIVFGDLFLEDIRAYRTERLAGTGIEPMFPIWCGPSGTYALADEMIKGGLRTVIATVDSRQLDSSFVGRIFDTDLLNDLPAGVDPLGENGEFHTFCYDAPIFHHPIDYTIGNTVERDEFIYIDLLAR